LYELNNVRGRETGFPFLLFLLVVWSPGQLVDFIKGVEKMEGSVGSCGPGLPWGWWDNMSVPQEEEEALRQQCIDHEAAEGERAAAADQQAKAAYRNLSGREVASGVKYVGPSDVELKPGKTAVLEFVLREPRKIGVLDVNASEGMGLASLWPKGVSIRNPEYYVNAQGAYCMRVKVDVGQDVSSSSIPGSNIKLSTFYIKFGATTLARFEVSPPKIGDYQFATWDSYSSWNRMTDLERFDAGLPVENPREVEGKLMLRRWEKLATFYKLGSWGASDKEVLMAFYEDVAAQAHSIRYYRDNGQYASVAHTQTANDILNMEQSVLAEIHARGLQTPLEKDLEAAGDGSISGGLAYAGKRTAVAAAATAVVVGAAASYAAGPEAGVPATVVAGKALAALGVIGAAGAVAAGCSGNKDGSEAVKEETYSKEQYKRDLELAQQLGKLELLVKANAGAESNETLRTIRDQSQPLEVRIAAAKGFLQGKGMNDAKLAEIMGQEKKPDAGAAASTISGAEKPADPNAAAASGGQSQISQPEIKGIKIVREGKDIVLTAAPNLEQVVKPGDQLYFSMQVPAGFDPETIGAVTNTTAQVEGVGGMSPAVAWAPGASKETGGMVTVTFTVPQNIKDLSKPVNTTGKKGFQFRVGSEGKAGFPVVGSYVVEEDAGKPKGGGGGQTKRAPARVEEPDIP
jgi:hypothetical protein